jgi:hypothetical protein
MYCGVIKENNLHIANSTYNPRKLPKIGQNKQINISYCVRNTVQIW